MIALFGLAMVMLAAILWKTNAFGAVSPNLGDVPLSNPPSNSLSGAVFSQEEIDAIFRYSVLYDVDARLMGAIRKAENGGPGREFGVVSIFAPDLDSQARAAAQTIANNVTRFQNQTGLVAYGDDGRYSDAFIEFLGSRYAPIGASNDPTNLNQYWVSNVESYYRRLEYAA